MEEGSQHQLSSSVCPEVPHASRAPGSLVISSPPSSLKVHPLFLLVASLPVAIADVHTTLFIVQTYKILGDQEELHQSLVMQQSSDLMDEPEMW